jgi:hypothetical protein
MGPWVGNLDLRVPARGSEALNRLGAEGRDENDLNAIRLRR